MYVATSIKIEAAITHIMMIENEKNEYLNSNNINFFIMNYKFSFSIGEAEIYFNRVGSFS